ncbi:ComF family protein [Bacillus methanolicus]|uniref:Late competence protein n=1 Tax=Bacillus methanolicus (strain MGA3 / ATCC 53907) TaxID=796606 RepID=I3EB06_BACMM|nr:ComF family protein [Bacillus methanolicus]AIE61361.1 late competence protein [Bacillus methanolicus MGA3]EIJ83677.1 late competence protein [Bacillus methanolicus MGA3]
MKIFQNDLCFICLEEIVPVAGWQALFEKEMKTVACQTCLGRFSVIEGETCRLCSRPFEHLEEQYRQADLCFDCIRWEEDSEWHGFLEKNNSLYNYNHFLKEVIARYKFRGDYALSKVFAAPLQEKLLKMNYDLLVPIPLSGERLYERGFNQAEALIKVSGFTPANVLTRVHAEKQSKKSRNERIHLSQVFQLDPGCSVLNKKIVLVDDIYTTGSTIRHAAKILKEAGAASVTSFTLARG